MGNGAEIGSLPNPPLLSYSSSRKGSSLINIFGFPPAAPPSSGKGLCGSAFPKGLLLSFIIIFEF